MTPLSIACIMLAAAAAAPIAREPVDEVDPRIGNIGQLLRATVPLVHLPHGMVRLAPITRPEIRDRYLADKIFGFAAGASSLMIGTGDPASSVESSASRFDHDFETVTPYQTRVLLEEIGVEASFAPSQHAAYYRFRPERGGTYRLFFRLGDQAEVAITADPAVVGSEVVDGVRTWFFARLRTAPRDAGVVRAGVAEARSSATGTAIGAWATVAAERGEPVDVKVGVSYISAEQARANVDAELPDWDYERVRRRARDAWNEALSKIEIVGGTPKERALFYTSLYRSLERPVNISEQGRYYSGYDRQVHGDDGAGFYVDDWLWDSYRTLHPLQLLLERQLAADVLRSYVRMYQQSGWMPLFPDVGGDRPWMLGHHAAALFADAWAKGIRGVDYEIAFKGLRKNALEATMLPWRNGPATSLDRFCFAHGFFPALAPGEEETVAEVHPKERRQAVSVTLEYAYDDWCLSRLAAGLGHGDDEKLFRRRSRNWKNVFNQKTGFMAPRSQSGAWIEPFDPKLGGGQGGRDYFAEVNSWINTFNVPHDLPGLVAGLGGRAAFEQRLDQLFIEQYGGRKYRFLAQFPDATGLIGQYAHGNEPGLHIPYLYNSVGAPWKTQRRVREILSVWYQDNPRGLCGDDDGGALSSWYVFSAVGLYPVVPGLPIYDLASPLFEKVVIHAGAKPFTILAPGASAQNKYIQRAFLDGAPLAGPWISHAAIQRGAVLRLELGPRPNASWGRDARPPPGR
ncbi:MAG: GH92 family glycosyl hydrolase [Deltaproteobacteria bacterium]|nr:GH92 family glycosyl hydrolase [Deltaproteobacteria bacterium]